MICDNKPKVCNYGCTNASIIIAIQTNEIVGDGTPDNPTRRISKYWSMDGELLASFDPIDVDERTVRIHFPDGINNAEVNLYANGRFDISFHA